MICLRRFVKPAKAEAIVKILMMVAADHATVEPQTGKLNVLGIFNRISALKFPAVQQRMCLVVKIEGEIADSRNPHTLSVALTDEDGIEMVIIEGGFEMPGNPPGIPPEHISLLEFNEIIFQKPGEYRLYVRVNDGETEESMVLQVVKRKQ